MITYVTMKRFPLKSIRTQLVLLILTATLPALAIIVYANIERQRHDTDLAKANTLMILRGLANEHESVVEATRRFVMTLAKLPAVQRRDAAACNALFRELLKDNSHYATIYAADLEGRVFANALPTRRIIIKERLYFQTAIRDKDFSVGEYTVGPVSQRSVLPFAYPIIAADGRIQGIVAVSLDLEKYGRSFLASTSFPTGATINILDRNHIRLYRHPEQERHAGKVDLPDMVRHMSSEPPEGMFIAPGVDGVRRLLAYRRFSLREGAFPYLFMRVGVPEKLAIAASRKNLVHNIAMLTGCVLFVMLAALLAANKLIVRRLNRLVERSQQLGRGDFAVRAGIDYREGELGQLAQSFDEMVAALAAKESDRQEAEAALRLSRDRYQAFVENSSEAICRFEMEGDPIELFPPVGEQVESLYDRAVVAECNRIFAISHGYDHSEEMIGFRLGQVFPRLAKENLSYLRRFLENGCQISGVETKSPARDGTMRYFLNNMIGHMEGNRLVRIWSVRQDITRLKQAEEALRKSEAELNRLIETLTVAFFVHAKGKIIYVNPAFLKLFKASVQAEAIGLRLTDFVPPELFDVIRERTRIMTEENHDLPPLEMNLRCRDGSVITVVSTSMPMIFKEQTAVLTALYDITERKRNEVELQKAHLLLQHNYRQIEELQARLKEQAIRDPLTELYNRRYLEESMGRELARATREEFPIGMIMIDIDHFKKVNDEHGHQAGDVMIQSLGALLLRGIRAGDIACRYGGEEFLLVLPKAPKDITAERAERCRTAFEEMTITHGEKTMRATISLGVAVYPADGATADEVINAADEALYRAKSTGRNCVVLS